MLSPVSRSSALRAGVVAMLATVAAPAWAGGVGLLVHGGMHQERAYYYSSHDENGAEIPERQNYDQYLVNQLIPQGGAGLEFLLGDRDDAVQGVFRIYYNLDTPQADPANNPAEGVQSDWVVSAHRDSARHTGMASMGLNWVVVGRNSDFKSGLSAHLGSGFLTNDHTEFFNLQVGPMVNYRLSKQVVGYADVHVTARFRKEFGMGTQAMAGVRYMFD